MRAARYPAKEEFFQALDLVQLLVYKGLMHGRMNNGLNIGGREYRLKRGLARELMLRNEWIDEVTDPDTLAKEIRNTSVPTDLLTFVQLPPNTVPKYSYAMQWENLAVLEVTTYNKWLKKQVPRNTRKKVLKAERLGVVVRIEAFSDELAVGLVELFNETPVRRTDRYPYFGWDIDRVRQGWATELERSLWLVAYYREEMIGFIKLILGGRIARASGTLAKLAHRDKAVMNALIAKAVEVCAEKSIQFLIYGRFIYGRKGKDSLTVFKENNGFRRVDVPRYYIPLTLRGRIVLRLGLHQGLKAIIPGPALRLLIKLRTKRYQKLVKS